MMQKRMNMVCPIACLFVITGLHSLAFAGDLNPPPGPIGPTMKTLTEIEPRVPVQTLPNSATAVYVISDPGSYYLTGNINGTAGMNGISILTDNVTLDLNGFTLNGSAGSLDGILIDGANYNFTIKNGIVNSWDGNGINAATGAHGRFETLSIGNSGVDGLRVGSDSSIRILSISGSGHAAIHVGGMHNRIEATQVTNNSIGIDVDGTENLIVKNNASGNATDYDIVAGNAFGPIALVSGVGDISTVTAANHPWANFSNSCTPGVELCDGLDNDCDTLVDEDFPTLGSSCLVGIGACQSVGTTVCSQDQINAQCSAIPGIPTPEICDGLDNDCDGIIDNGCPLSCTSDSDCQAAELCCGGTCVDPTSDLNNCGACATVCPSGSSCDGGLCLCPAGMANCGDACADLASDSNNCGACATVCPSGASCLSGVCSCPAGTINCGGVCLDTTSDLNNCGLCGNVCPSGASCDGGACTCPAGTVECGGACADLASDSNNCGACGSVCQIGSSCVSGVCSCSGGTFNCGGLCVDPASDPNNCGGCGNSCQNACESGACVISCSAGLNECNGACVNTDTDIFHCGGCASPCNTGETCVNGNCQP